jgi:uncharacterized membrane protein YdbT with pleckstrin-like domain
MMNILGKLSGVPQQIMIILSESSSGIINKIGIASLTTSGTNAIVTTALETKNETWLSISDAVAVVSIVGSVVFIIKLSADFYYARRKDKREQELHDRQMK